MTRRSVSIPVSRPFAITPWLPFRLDERERGGCRPSTGSSRRARAVAVVFSLDQHGPDNARGFGGECHHGDLVGSCMDGPLSARAFLVFRQVDRGAVMYTASRSGH